MEDLTGKKQEKNLPSDTAENQEATKVPAEEAGRSAFRYLFEKEGSIDPYDYVKPNNDAEKGANDEKTVVWDYHQWEKMTEEEEEHPLRDSVRNFWGKLAFRKSAGKKSEEGNDPLEDEIMEQVSRQEIDDLLEQESPVAEKAGEPVEEGKTEEPVESAPEEEALPEPEKMQEEPAEEPKPEKPVESAPEEEALPEPEKVQEEPAEEPNPEKPVESAPEEEALPEPEKMQEEPAEEAKPEEPVESAPEEIPEELPPRRVLVDFARLYRETADEAELIVPEKDGTELIREAFDLLSGAKQEEKTEPESEPAVEEIEPVEEVLGESVSEAQVEPVPEIPAEDKAEPEEEKQGGIFRKLFGMMQAGNEPYETVVQDEPAVPDKSVKANEEPMKKLPQEEIPEEDPTYEEAKEGLRQKRKIQLIRTAVCGAMTLFLSLLAILSHFPNVAPTLSQTENPALFLTLNLLGLLVGCVVCLPTITVGLGDFLNGKNRAGADGATAFAVLACLVQALILLLRSTAPSVQNVLIAAPVGVGILCANALGKLILLRRVGKNFYWIGQNNLHVLKIVGESPDMEVVPCKVKRLERFLPISMQEDCAEQQSASMTFPALVVALACTILTMVITRDFVQGLTAFAVGCCLAAPATALLAVGIPMSKSCRKLRKSGAVLASWEAVDRLGEVDRVTVWDVDLFPPERAVLRQIKIFGSGRVEEIVPTAEALLQESGGPILGVLSRTIHGEHRIPVAEQIEYEKGGVVGWIDGRRVMIGGRVLLERHGIDVPSREYEKQNYPDGQNVLYFADGGELVAAFLVEYGTEEALGEEIRMLAEYSCDFTVLTNDGSITAEWMTERFELPEECVTVVSGKDALRAAEPEAESAETFAAANRTGLPVLRVLAETIRLKQKASLAVILQGARVWIGLLLLVIFCLAGALLKLNSVQLLAYEAIWIAAILGIPAIR